MCVVVRGDDLQSIDRERGIRSSPLQPSAVGMYIERTPLRDSTAPSPLLVPLDWPGGYHGRSDVLVLDRRDLTCHPALCLLH